MKKNIHLICILTCFILCASCSTLLNALDGSETYSGTVIDKKSNKPLSGAMVKGSYFWYDGFNPFPESLFADGGFFSYVQKSTKFVLTDDNGKFSITIPGHNRIICVKNKHDYNSINVWEIQSNKKIVIELKKP